MADASDNNDLTKRQLLASMLAAGGFSNISGSASDIPSSIDPDEEPDSEAQPVPKEGPYTPLINVPRNQNNGYSPGRYPPSADYRDELKGGPGSMLAMALAGGAPSPASQAPVGPPPSQPAPSASHYAHLPGPPLLLPGAEDNGPPIPGGGQSNPSGGPLDAIKQMLGMGGAAPPAPTPAATAAPVSASTPIAGQTSDMAGGDQYTPYLKQHEAEAQWHYNQALALAQSAAASGNPQAAEQAEEWIKQAQSYKAEVLHWQEEIGATLKPKGRLLTDEEIKAAGLPDGVYNRSAEGITSPVGTYGKEEPAPVQEWKAVNEDRAKRGQPELPLNDFLMEKSFMGKADRPLMDASGTPVDTSLTGDELLAALPPEVANHAKAIAEIRERWPSGTEQARQPQLQQAIAAAQKLDPTLNQQTYQTRQSMRNAAESGSGRINVANLANNTALFHSNTLSDAIVGLNNSNNTWLNATINAGAGPTGGIIPGAVNKADAVKQFEVARNAVSNELERSFHGVGTTAEQAVKRQIDDLSVNDAPQTQLGALKAAQELLKGKITANEADYRDTMGEKNIAAWERDHGRPFGFITPAAQASGDRVAAMYESVRAGKGFHGFEATPAQGAQQGTTQPVPVKTPDEARALPRGTPIVLPDGRRGVVP